MPDLVTGDGFAELFSSFRRTARRLESRSRYLENERGEASFSRFLAGQYEDPGYAASRSSWLDDTVRAAIDSGKRFERVRVVDEPLSDYQRFGLRNCRDNVAAGEDIRYLSRGRANQLDLPEHDFWLFDDELLALLWFTADHRLLGAQVTTDRALVAQHRHWLTIAWPEATPYADFLAADPSRERPPLPGEAL